MNPTLWLAVVAGALICGGAALAVLGLRRAPVRLSDAIASLDGGPDEGPAAGAGARNGWRLITRIPLLPGVDRRLALRGMSVGDLYVEKGIHALIGLLTPAVVGSVGALVLGWPIAIPAIGAPICASLGFVVPDLRVLRGSAAVKVDAGEALFTYFDLVTLERLANASASQALAAAARLSDAVLFVEIRGALERARLEQRPPYAELHRLADRLDLPELADIADVMRLDETGAALSGALRARVKELRNAHLTRERIAAQAVSERMTLWMTLPSLIFALIFLIPPLLRLLSS